MTIEIIVTTIIIRRKYTCNHISYTLYIYIYTVFLRGVVSRLHNKKIMSYAVLHQSVFTQTSVSFSTRTSRTTFTDQTILTPTSSHTDMFLHQPVFNTEVEPT